MRVLCENCQERGKHTPFWKVYCQRVAKLLEEVIKGRKIKKEGEKKPKKPQINK